MKIEHIALYVEDLEEARNFFIKYLGAKANNGYHNPRTNFRSNFLSSFFPFHLITAPIRITILIRSSSDRNLDLVAFHCNNTAFVIAVSCSSGSADNVISVCF